MTCLTYITKTWQELFCTDFRKSVNFLQVTGTNCLGASIDYLEY